MDHLKLKLDLWRPEYYRPNLFDSEKHDFHNFPEQMKWHLSNDTLEFTPQPGVKSNQFNQFLQSWLFFGLLSTILEVDARKLSLDLTEGDFIETTKLNEYLEAWKAREVATRDSDSRSLRMIRTQVALDKARQIVIAYCSDGGEQVKSESNPCYVDQSLGLSLMVLGETLTNAKSKIVGQVGFNIRGWHGDASDGWGTPPCILKTMKRKKWCKKWVEALRLQLKSHATSLLAAYSSHTQTDAQESYLIEGHDTCTKDQCNVNFKDDKGNYIMQHQLNCRRHPEHEEYSTDETICMPIGPDIKKVVDFINRPQVPLMEYNRNKGEIDVVMCEPYIPYATLSHVWSDGYGNPSENKLWKCQLDFFDDLFEEAQKSSPALGERKLFWIDTLAIPIHLNYRDERKIAVRQIHQVYTNARYTIVIDKGLGRMDATTTYEGAAMRILASGWMRRLWTLQEAYLSRRLYFAFAKGKLKNLEDLEDMYPKANDILASSIPSAARNYFHNLLGNDRRARINDLPAGSGTEILASVWKAARWRTTNHQEHETLALATLLNVDYENSKFQDAGLMKKQGVTVTEDQLESMMRDLWELLDKTCPGSIPPGIIFLPGEKLKDERFAWAPRTWMVGQELDYPDPLSNMTGAATLVPEGLLVRYPGFILHAKDYTSILGENENSFHFPCDSTLLEWYVVVMTDLQKSPPKGNRSRNKQLAIILCRPKPREIPEIALLVEIREIIHQRSFADRHHQSKIYHVSYDRRVKISRQTNANQISEWRNSTMASMHKDNTTIYGEVLDNDQRWYVGGREPLVKTASEVKDDAGKDFAIQNAATLVEAQTTGPDKISTVNAPEVKRSPEPITLGHLGGLGSGVGRNSSVTDLKTNPRSIPMSSVAVQTREAESPQSDSPTPQTRYRDQLLKAQNTPTNLQTATSSTGNRHAPGILMMEPPADFADIPIRPKPPHEVQPTSTTGTTSSTTQTSRSGPSPQPLGDALPSIQNVGGSLPPAGVSDHSYAVQPPGNSPLSLDRDGQAQNKTPPPDRKSVV